MLNQIFFHWQLIIDIRKYSRAEVEEERYFPSHRENSLQFDLISIYYTSTMHLDLADKWTQATWPGEPTV